MENKKYVYPADTYGFHVPKEVLSGLMESGKPIRLIPESKVADLTYADVSGSSYHVVKRALDIIISSVALIVLCIPMLVIALVIKLTSPGKVVFTQKRVGLKGKRFRVAKFRTMRADTPKYMPTGEVADPDMYITPVGRILRKTSLDELPQLLNVLWGNMSLVGPRPLIADEVEIHRMRMRFGVYNVRPGITGLAQVNGRDTVSRTAKVRYDVQYVHNFSFRQDLAILFSTFPKVFGGKGVVEGKRND